MANPVRPHLTSVQRPDPAAVLTKSVLRASALLGLTNSTLATVLGVSEATVSRLVAGSRMIDPGGKEGELALLVVRVYRSLDALVGSDDEARRAWMGGTNHALQGKPAELIKTAQGLVSVAAYLDAMRAPA